MTARQSIPVTISPDILDTIGKSFRFKHAKGVAEWLKNSLDSYLRLRDDGKESRSGGWPVFISLSDSRGSKPSLAVIDFGGTSLKNVENFLLHWGDRKAATLGGSASRTAVTGGHGNGGKFYMREMWQSGARFLTWRDGKATSLIVDKKEKDKSGEWEFKNVEMTWRQAMEKAMPAAEGSGHAQELIQHMETHEKELVSELDAGKRGLTVLFGRKAAQNSSSNDVVNGGRWNGDKLIDEIREAPQARRPIRELAVSIFQNGALKIKRLSLATIAEDPNWPMEVLTMPMELLSDKTLAQDATNVGTLHIVMSDSQLTGRMKDHNSVFVMDGAGNPIAFYPLRELPALAPSPYSSFVHAELQLTFPHVDDLVQNDRERLVSGTVTQAILTWTGERVSERIQVVEEAQHTSKNRSELQMAAIFNDALNQHAKLFLQELQSQILIDVVEDPKGGGPGSFGNGTGPIRTGEEQSNDPPQDPPQQKGGSPGEGGSLEVPGTTQKVNRPKFPQVLLSEMDADPGKTDGTSKRLTDRHPPLHQDDDDRRHNVWWINTTHPFAVEAIKHGGAKGSAFKNHQFFMFRDVVQREGLRILQRRESEMGLDMVETELDRISNDFLAALPHDLTEKLLG